MNLILFVTNKDKFFINNLRKNLINEYEIFEIYKECNFILRILRKIYFKVFKNFKFVWYGTWFSNQNNYEKIILFDSILDIEIVNDIQKKFFKSKLIFWLWNKVDDKKKEYLDYLKSKKIEIWSFDKEDCNKYNLKYNTQFYFMLDTKRISKINKKDIYFIGGDENRIEILEKLNEEFEKMNIKCEINILKQRFKKYSLNQRKLLINKPISYGDVIKNVMESFCILEINRKNQSGLTLRVMESLFLEKKLISNNKNLKNYKFYNPDNIFILREDLSNIEEIKNFLKIPYKKIDEKIKKEYLITEWVLRF